MPRRRLFELLTVAMLVTLVVPAAEAQSFAAPWDGFAAPSAVAQSPPRRSPLSWPGEIVTWSLGAFQRYLSPLDGPRCTLTPTCSTYSLQAIAEHGTVVGLLLTFDRLLHEFDEFPLLQARSRVTYRDGSWVGQDPLAANDWWFFSVHPSGASQRP